jgi:glycolate oxidase FAD binding subunit
VLQPNSIDELREAILSHACLLPKGNSSKPGLISENDPQFLSMGHYSGLLEYEPSEYTFTALAGTPVNVIESILAEHGQFLPFDPPFVDNGATLGGVLASGLSGSGRFRYGGVRDFILGVVFMDGEGRLVRSGGKVVKNAAGFDLPKLMTGSLGTFGAILELSFKVFPRPATFRTMISKVDDVSQVRNILSKLSVSPLELYCLDIFSRNNGITMYIRIAGPPDSLKARIERLKIYINQESEHLEGTEESEYWRNARNFNWVPAGWSLVKVPITPNKLPELERQLKDTDTLRRYTVGGNLAWISCDRPLDYLDKGLKLLDLSGIRILGTQGPTRLGSNSENSFYRRVKNALDPKNRWAEVSA